MARRWDCNRRARIGRAAILRRNQRVAIRFSDCIQPPVGRREVRQPDTQVSSRRVPDHRRSGQGTAAEDRGGRLDAAHGRARAADALRHPRAAHAGLPLPRRLRGQRRRRPRGAVARAPRAWCWSTRARRPSRRPARTRARSLGAGGEVQVFRQDARDRAAGARRRGPRASTSSTSTRPTRASSTSRSWRSPARACWRKTASWSPNTSTSARFRRE